MWQKIPPFFRNKYVLVVTAFLVWLTFFDRNNFISQVRLGQILTEKRVQKDFYLDEIKRDSISMHEFMSDTVSLEKFGREKYIMKKDDEDVYLIVREKKEK
jgi:cell division protein DivIC